MTMLIWIIGALLLVVSLIDWKVQRVPSILLTSMIFAVACLYPAHLWFGVLGFVMAFLLYEGGVYGGIADIKVMTVISFMVSSIYWLFALILVSLVYGLVWKTLWHWRFKAKRKKLPDEFPFLPVFFFVYVALWICGGLG